MPAKALVAALLLCAGIAPAGAEELRVSNPEELTAALEAAAEGDEIVLEPGIYAGRLYRENLQQVTIRSADPDDPAVIRGGEYGLMLSDPNKVTLSDLIFEEQLDNGINIDDGGSYETPARDIRLLRITVRDMVNRGNRDAIKMAGVENFLIDGVRVENWGDDGSAIDFVGCRNGLIQNSLLIHNKLKGGSGIRPKGGSKHITIRANRVELPVGAGRAIQAGGSTDAEFFRFADGDQDYEADDVTIEGNVVIGGGAAFSWVNINGGVVHHNLVQGPSPWVLRILNENEGSSIIATQNGQFFDNEIAFETGGSFNRTVNVGDETEPGTFRFARNRWYNIADPTPDGSRPELPAEEAEGAYGEELRNAVDRAQVWEFPWGKWIVNATTQEQSVEVPDYAELKRVRIAAARFAPLEDPILAGAWRAEDLEGGRLTLPPMSQAILIEPDACANCVEQ